MIICWQDTETFYSFLYLNFLSFWWFVRFNLIIFSLHPWATCSYLFSFKTIIYFHAYSYIVSRSACISFYLLYCLFPCLNMYHQQIKKSIATKTVPWGTPELLQFFFIWLTSTCDHSEFSVFYEYLKTSL